MAADTFGTNTGPDSTGRAEGVLVTIPASRQGLLVYFGGVSFPHEDSTKVAVSRPALEAYQHYTAHAAHILRCGQSFLCDIAEAKWYQQKATGQVPGNRRKFCAGVVRAQDQSSYNIYLYGGA